ncbi:hypothetical protein EW145_g577 [Phellinidium pouzarii]|uniref:Zn-dependent exopeptidase n=1 Tax=Phellinidium pouzarii TaxID=167371 RepID=A0A4S4LNA5_9AGAM|nr:hypothetical protein EW145_g577 [Phellinidium pouzarii]
MVVVLDAMDYDEARLIEVDIEQPLLASGDTSKPTTPQLEQRLPQRGRWIMRAGLIALALSLVRIAGMKQNAKNNPEQLSSILDGCPNGLSIQANSEIPLASLLDPEKAEKLFLSVPSTKSAFAASRQYATHPHIAGSVEDYEDAKVILDLFQTQFDIPAPEDEPIFSAGTPESRSATLGIPFLSSPQAWIDVYYPFMNVPLNRSLEILDSDGNVAWAADLVEDGDPGDPEAAKYRDAVPTFHGLSKDGEVEGELVYVNYGTKEDYDELVASGTNLTGKIVIARYGEIFRGLKIKGAEERGAIGALIYSDPRDDGAVTVENGYAPYPAGPAHNPTAVQRGSVQFISIYPGDPTTPGYPAYENSTRTEGTNKPSIPSLPISWQNAERLFEEIGSISENTLLSGQTSKRKVKLVNHVDDKVMPIWNTMAVIPGHIKDEVVMVGCHRDAWVMGGADPTSGTVSLHEVIRGFGALLRSGWKPLRTIVFASWDAEEYGLVGSTEWGEDFGDWIKDHVVAYLQIDIAASGSRFNVQASPSLSQLIVKTAKDIPHPTKEDQTLWDAVNDNGPFEGAIDHGYQERYDSKRVVSKNGVPGVSPVGSGSDFTVFLQHLGVAVAQNLGLLALRFADAIILPLNTTQYALELDDYLDVVEEISLAQAESPDLSALRRSIKNLQKASFALDAEKEEAEARLRELLDEMRKNILRSHKKDMHRHRKLWCRMRSFVMRFFGFNTSPSHHDKNHVHSLNMPSSSSSYRGIQGCNVGGEDARSAEEGVEVELAPHNRHPHVPSPDRKGSAHHSYNHVPIHKFIRAAKRVRRANKKLSSYERGFISEDGIKDREWYLHLGVAPGKWLGYGATTLPGLTEALTIEQNLTLAVYEAGRLQALIDKLTAEIHI